MYNLLVRLMLVAAFSQLGISLADTRDCRGRGCVQRLAKASYEVLKIDWKPVSVFSSRARANSPTDLLYSRGFRPRR